MEKLFVDKWLTSIEHWLLDLFFPIECLGCQADGSFLCDQCFERIPEREYQECPLCRTPYTQAGAVCKKCRGKTTLDGLLIATPYKFRLVEKTIHALKYQFIPALATPLARLIERSLAHTSLALPDAIVPVPLHPRRLRYRGFNQATLLAQALTARLAPGLEIPIIEPIERIRFTKPQMKTTAKEERINNLSGAFKVEPEVASSLVGKYVWLIDDVATTGTTLEECTKVLKQAGVTTIWGIVVAR